MSLRDKILAAPDIKTEKVEIPEWGVTVEVKGLTGRRRSILYKESTNKKGDVDIDAFSTKLVILSTYDIETGEPVFQNGDFDALAEKSAGAIERIVNVATRLSGLDQEEAKKN